MKLNNKGFAVSIILYSISAIFVLVLLLILAVDASNFKNSTNMSDEVKENISEIGQAYEAIKTTTTYAATDVGHKHRGTAGLDYANGCYTKQSTDRVVVGGGRFIDNGVLPCGCSASKCDSCGVGAVYYNPTGCTLYAHGDGTASPGWSHPHYEDRTVYKLGCGKTESNIYTCPKGGTLSGTTCTKVVYSCPKGGVLDGTMCKF